MYRKFLHDQVPNPKQTTHGSRLPQDNISVFFLTKSFWPMYHYMVPWDWKCGEFGSYADGCATFFIKIWHELGYVTLLQTTDSEDVRGMLHEVSKKKMTLAEGLEKLKEKSMYNAKKMKLMVRNWAEIKSVPICRSLKRSISLFFYRRFYRISLPTLFDMILSIDKSYTLLLTDEYKPLLYFDNILIL